MKRKVKTLSLMSAWKHRLELHAEGYKLWAEGYKLRAEGDKLWAEAVIEAYGNVMIEWMSRTHCIVNGEDEFKG